MFPFTILVGVKRSLIFYMGVNGLDFVLVEKLDFSTVYWYIILIIDKYCALITVV